MNAINFYTEGVGSCSFDNHLSGHGAIAFVDCRACNACTVNCLPVFKISNFNWRMPIVVIVVVSFNDNSETIVDQSLEVQVAVLVHKVYFETEGSIRSQYW